MGEEKFIMRKCEKMVKLRKYLGSVFFLKTRSLGALQPPGPNFLPFGPA